MIGRVEGHRDGSRKERKGRKELNHEIHRIHGNGRARWSHPHPLSSVVSPSPCQERKEDGWLDRISPEAVGRAARFACRVAIRLPDEQREEPCAARSQEVERALDIMGTILFKANQAFRKGLFFDN